MITPAAAAAKWAQRLSASGDAVKAGVNALQVNPMEQAAQAADRWFSGVQQSYQSGTFQAGLRAVSFSDWKTAMTDKGVSNMQTGARTGQNKVQTFLNKWLPYAQTISDTTKAMPRGSLQDSINRAAKAIEMAAQFRKNG